MSSAACAETCLCSLLGATSGHVEVCSRDGTMFCWADVSLACVDPPFSSRFQCTAWTVSACARLEGEDSCPLWTAYVRVAALAVIVVLL